MPGFPDGVHLKGGVVSAVVNREAAREFYAPLLPIVADLHRQGLSLRAIARALDSRGIRTRHEWQHWSAQQVKRVLARALEAEAAATTAPSHMLDRRARAAALLERCHVAGITFTIENGRSVYSATPEAEQDVALIEEVRSDELDAELLELVTEAAFEKTIRGNQTTSPAPPTAKATELLERCRVAGVILSVRNGNIFFSGVPVSYDLFMEIVGHKPEVIQACNRG